MDEQLQKNKVKNKTLSIVLKIAASLVLISAIAIVTVMIIFFSVPIWEADHLATEDISSFFLQSVTPPQNAYTTVTVSNEESLDIGELPKKSYIDIYQYNSLREAKLDKNGSLTGRAKMIPLEKAEEFLNKGYVFGGHVCDYCSLKQEIVSFEDYDFVDMEFLFELQVKTGQTTRTGVPFYTFYKKIESTQDGVVYAKLFVPAIEITGYEEYFEKQKEEHKKNPIKIEEPKEPEAPLYTEGLEYYTLSDGTYGVKAGSAIGLKEIIIPDIYEGIAVTQIGENAFKGAQNLTKVTLPEGITVIGNEAFSQCTKLSTINFPDSVTSIGDFAFFECKKFKSLNFGENSQLKSIGNSAFAYSRLEIANLPKTMSSIGDNAFYECENLSLITIPDGITCIGNGTFYACSSMTKVSFPEGLISVGDEAFSFCSSLEEITLPATIQNIGSRAFSPCSSVRNLVIPEGVKTIGKGAFGGCTRLKTISLPGSLQTIEKSAFGGCNQLEEITFAENSQLTTIGDLAFDGCSILESITLPKSLKTIGEKAFFNCNSLKELNIPEGVTTIGDLAFYFCTSLKKITIPNTVSHIGKTVFKQCASLKDVIFDGTTSEWLEISETKSGSFTIHCNNKSIPPI